MIRDKLREIKNIVQVITFLLFNSLFKKVPPDPQPNTLLIVRLDGIGDYILFRNFIEQIKKSDKFKDYKFTLCGNVAWREIAEKLDGGYINSYIWIDIQRFMSFFRGFFYRLRIARELQKTNYEVVFSPTYSRSLITNDIVASMLFAKKIVGVAGDFSNISTLQNRIGKRYYTELISVDRASGFEFYVNKRISETFLGAQIDIDKPSVTITKEPQFYVSTPTKPFAAIFLGASQLKRKWPVEKFLEIAKLINGRFRLKIALLGTVEDSSAAQLIADSMPKNEVTNFTGNIGLINLISIIANATLLISNDTCAFHFAAAVNIPFIVISNGRHYGRFHPYPAEMGLKNLAVYPKKFNHNYQLNQSSGGISHSSYDINDVSIDDVANAVFGLMYGYEKQFERTSHEN